MPRKRSIVTVFALVAASFTTSAQAPVTRPLRILFVGNSHTATNLVPDVVTRLAMAAGHPQPLTQMVAVGGFSLEDHWNQGDAQRTIGSGRWDFVVLQQGPSALPESRRLLVDYARRFGAVITKAGARPALFMVWPSQARRGDFGGVSESYRAAAAATGGLVLAAGDAWSLILNRRLGMALYDSDGVHATFAGSYLAALVIVQGLYGQSPIGLPALGDLSPEQARALRDAAIDVRDPPVRAPIQEWPRLHIIRR
jgi:hypothetical protein